MRNPVLVGLGVVVALFGVLFTLQGLGYVKGSPMTGSNFWAVAGPLIAVAGAAVATVGVRGRGRADP
jgi:hypothetical protein